ncbi:MAG: DNA recombination protein RmuC [Acidimicrobiaceae bacterium]|nr:DNA recombination protein RmuC [Acidimicrobiaceae bacterium]
MTDLPTLIIVAIISIAAGALGTGLFWLWTRHRPSEPQADGGLAGLAEATAALGVRVNGVHEMLVDLLRVQATAEERLAVVGEQTRELHLTLANPQRRGDWGQLLCEDILRSTGFQHRIHYEKQLTFPDGTGRPDFTVFVADGRLLHVDAKFPLPGYRKLEQAETDEARDAARKEFIADIKRHVKAVVDSGYVASEATVGFCVLFFASPAVFAAAVEADRDLIQHALERRVVLTDAGTLMAVLMLVKSASDAFRFQSHTRDILRIVAEFQSEWGKFTQHLDTCDKQLATFSRSFGRLTSTRRRQLQRQLDRIDGLDTDDEHGENIAPEAVPPLCP